MTFWTSRRRTQFTYRTFQSAVICYATSGISYCRNNRSELKKHINFVCRTLHGRPT